MVDLKKMKIGDSVIIAMARGTIVVDENLENIIPFIKGKNIRVITPNKGLKDDEIKKTMLANRIFVTNNVKDFLKDAPILDCGLISTENIKFKGENLAKMISDVLTDMNLWSKRHGFLVVLKENGKHDFKPLVD